MMNILSFDMRHTTYNILVILDNMREITWNAHLCITLVIDGICGRGDYMYCQTVFIFLYKCIFSGVGGRRR
jgi:hypothetical protein